MVNLLIFGNVTIFLKHRPKNGSIPNRLLEKSVNMIEKFRGRRREEEER